MGILGASRHFSGRLVDGKSHRPYEGIQMGTSQVAVSSPTDHVRNETSTGQRSEPWKKIQNEILEGIKWNGPNRDLEVMICEAGGKPGWAAVLAAEEPQHFANKECCCGQDGVGYHGLATWSSLENLAKG